jgi:hypothetical protein
MVIGRFEFVGDLQDDALAAHGRETLRRDGDGVATGIQAHQRVDSGVVGDRLPADVSVLLGGPDHCVGNGRPGGITDFS